MEVSHQETAEKEKSRQETAEKEKEKEQSRQETAILEDSFIKDSLCLNKEREKKNEERRAKERQKEKERRQRKKAAAEQAKIDQITGANVSAEMQRSIDPRTFRKQDDAQCLEIGKLWKFITNKVSTPEGKREWMSISDNDKVKMIVRMFRDLTQQYPIICKYMVILGKYSETAFRRYLQKCRENRADIRPIDASNPQAQKIMTRQAKIKSCENNAWYRVYLGEAYARKTQPNLRVDPRVQRSVYQQSYDLLIKELDDMDEMKSEAEVAVKERQVRVTHQAVDEVVGSLREGSYKTMTVEEKMQLLELLQSIKQRQATDAPERHNPASEDTPPQSAPNPS